MLQPCGENKREEVLLVLISKIDNNTILFLCVCDNLIIIGVIISFSSDELAIIG